MAKQADQLAQTIQELKKQDKGKLSSYQKDLLKWSENVDKNYAWVVLLALWLMIFAINGVFRIYSLVYAKVTADGYYTREEATWPVAMTLTTENLFGVASIIIQRLSFRRSMLIGGLLIVAGNGLTAFSSNVLVDTLLLGLLQGVGHGFIFMPFMSVINSYFLKYRTIAFGAALTGGTLSIFGFSPLFQWLLRDYFWRYSYLALGAVCCTVPLTALLLKPNPMPELPAKIIQNSLFELTDQSRVTSTGNLEQCVQQINETHNRPLDGTNKLDLTIIWRIFKLPAFHMIWLTELIVFWVSTIYVLVQVDYGLDHGCSQEEAEYLLQCLSLGEIIGRLLLPYLVDAGRLRHQNVVIITLLAKGLALIAATQITGFISLAMVSVAITATYSLLYILLNGLFVQHLGEAQVTLGYGLASFISGLLMIFRPQAVGYFRDNLGSYDPLMLCLAGSCLIAAILWILEPLITKFCTKNRADFA